MEHNDFQVLAPDPAQHLDKIARLAADAFSGGNYADAYACNYIGGSHYDWLTSRLIFAGETLVHQWGVWGYLMRLERAQLKVAGIGAVVTHPDYRTKGLMHRAAQSSFTAMAEAGYDLSILRGRHYLKMGYARAWNYITYRLNLAEIPAGDAPAAFQPLGLERVPEMDTLYNQTHAAFPGTAVRPTYRNRHPEDLGVQAWFDASGKLTGYVRGLPAEDDPKTLLCLEAAGDPHQALAVLAELYRQGGYEKLACFSLPHQHPLLRLLRKGSLIVEERYFAVSGWRVRIVNLGSTLQKLLPLFEERLAQSRFADWQGTLLLDGGRPDWQALLRIQQGRVQVEPPGPAENILPAGADLARFLIGSADPDEIAAQAGMQTSPTAAALARVLFPDLHPILSHWDEI